MTHCKVPLAINGTNKNPNKEINTNNQNIKLFVSILADFTTKVLVNKTLLKREQKALRCQQLQSAQYDCGVNVSCTHNN